MDNNLDSDHKKETKSFPGFGQKKNLIIERNDVPGLPNPKTNTKDLFTKPSYAFCPQKNHVIPIENL